MSDLNSIRRLALIGICLIGISANALAADAKKYTLFTNIDVYNGLEYRLYENLQVLIEDNQIIKIGESIDAPADAIVIDGGGRTLMPGLIDTHTHFQLVVAAPDLENLSAQEIAIKMVPIAEDMLMRGFTLTRDLCGNTHGLRNAINQGTVVGPRIVSAGACIGGVSSHADFMGGTYRKQRGSNVEDLGFSIIADGPDQIREAMRSQFRKGASFIKIMLGGGLASAYDPLDATTYSLEELKAAVDEARRWGTYITAHVYNDTGIKLGLEAGMTTFEHTHLASEEIYKEFAERDMTLSQQVSVVADISGDHPAFVTKSAKAKADYFGQNAAKSFEYIKKYDIKAGFGVDSYGSLDAFRFNSKAIEGRKPFFSDEMILEQMFRHNMTLINMTGERLPYRDYKLGQITVGSYADIILVEGNPLEDVSILGDWENRIDLVMKDGVIYRSELD